MKKTATLIQSVTRRMIQRCKSNVKSYLTVLFLLSGLMFASQKSDAQCNSFGIDFKQGANRDGGYEPGQIHWIGSILQNSNSRYIEGMSTLQRIVMNNLPSCGQGYHKLRIKMQSRKGDNHAYDFLTSWDNAFLAAAAIAPGFDIFPASRTDAVNDLNECGQEIGACAATACGVATGGTFRDLPIVDGEQNLVIVGPPADQNTIGQIIPEYETRYGNRTVRVYVGAPGFGGANADANNEVVFVGYGDANPNDGGDSYIYYDIKWVSTSPDVVIEFGAHIAVGVDGLPDINPADGSSLGVGYLLNRGASAISGGPYHVIVEDFQPTTLNDPKCEGNLGNLDNQLQGSQILLIPSCNLQGPSSVCTSGTATYTATVTNPSAATYEWTIINSNQGAPGAQIIGSATGNVPAPIPPATSTPLSITVSTDGVGSYTVKLTINNGGQSGNTTDDDISSSCTVNTTVSGGPSIVCPPNRTEAACQSQSAINAAFLAWLQSVTPAGASNSGGSAPNKCGGTITVTFTATNTCGTATCSASFTVTADNTPPAFTGSYADQNLGCNPADPTGSLGTATATDNCGATTITSSDGAVVSTGCNRARTRTFTATDGCNNTATTTRTVRWIADVTPPTFTGSYADVNLGCNPGNPDGSLGTATATDGCGAVTITSSDGAVQSSGCNRSRTRTFTATDGCLNTATTSRTVRWIFDVTPPVFTGSYADVNLSCNPADPDGSLGTATATDACGAVTITSSDGAVQSSGCNRSRTRTFTATDGCLNTATTSRTVRWIFDNTPPVFTSPTTPIDLGCVTTEVDAFGSIGGATATDACGAVTITPSDGNIQSVGCSRTATRTFTARDACGNTATTSRSVTFIFDPNPPVFTGSYADVNLGCNPGNPDGSLGTATATDGCGAVTITSSDGAVQSSGCNRSRTRTFTATDACLNTASTSRTVRWIVDVTPPVFTGSYADVNLGCNPGNPDGSLGTATATDGCGAVTITSSDGAVQSSGCNRSRTRTFTATDGCLNTATASRTVRWIFDVTPPSFTGSYADVNLGCNPGNPDGSLGTATATDGCGAVTITSSDGAVGSDGCARWRTRTFTATDGCLNTSTTSRTVRWIADLTPPSFTGSYADVNLGCNPGNPDGSLGTATATDGCGAVTITSSDGAVVSDGCNRSRTRTFTATDGCLNTATTSRTVRWISDVTPPAFTGSYADVNLGCNPGNPDGSLGTATATDACGAVTITSSDGAVQSSGCNRSRTRTFTATDGCLNTATTSRTVRWISDVTPPAFTGSYADVNLGCNPGNPDGSLGTATATDACGAVTITSSDGAVQSSGCNRSRTRTFTATDGCLNTATTSRTVRWISDVTPPSFTGSYADVNLGCNPANPDGSLGTATATDVCGAVTITSSDGAVVSSGCNRSRTRTFTATDACLNTSTTSRTVRWIADLTGPTITCAANFTAACGAIPTFATPSATDACGGATVTAVGGVVVAGTCPTTHTQKWMAIDACGNTSTCSQTITVPCCAENCTYTQGAYGSANGSHCDGENTYDNTVDLLTKLLGINPGPANPLTIGRPGHSLTVPATADGRDDFIEYMPAGGPTKAPLAGDCDITNACVNAYLKNDNFNSVLIGQTFALSLNLRLSADLGSFDLQGGWLITQEQSGCGDDAVVVSCATDAGALQSFYFDPAVVAYLDANYGGSTVADLLDLANDALGAVITPGTGGVPSWGLITDAVDAVNRGFDECRSFYGWSACEVTCANVIYPDPCNPPVTRISTTPMAEVDQLAVSAYPNPFTDRVRFVIRSKVAGQGSLEIYNMLGQKIETAYKGNIVAEGSQTIEYKTTTKLNGGLIYIFRVGGKQVTGKLLKIEQ